MDNLFLKNVFKSQASFETTDRSPCLLTLLMQSTLDIEFYLEF